MRPLIPVILLLAIGCEPAPVAQEPVDNLEPKSEAPAKPSVLGKWVGTIQLGEKDKANLTLDQIKEAEKQAAEFILELEVMEDGTYTVVAPGETAHGKWTFENGQLTLTDSQADSASPQDGDVQILTLENGGTKLVGTDPSGGSDSIMVFVREAEPQPVP